MTRYRRKRNIAQRWSRKLFMLFLIVFAIALIIATV